MAIDFAHSGKTSAVGPVRVLSAWETRRAARTAAHHSTTADELAEFLSMLGLTAQQGKDNKLDA